MDRSLGVTEFVRTHLPEWLVSVAELTALLGDELLIVGVLFALAGVDAYRSARRGAPQLITDRTAFVLAIVLGGLAFTLILKTTFGLPRPPSSLQAVPREGDGFPSGHTMAATLLWTALALWGLRGRLTRRLRLSLAAAIITVVAASRLALGVHYLVDVVASVIFATAFLLVGARLADDDPTKAFAGAAILGALALVADGGSTDGILAFAGCFGGAVTWWIISRPAVKKRWATVVQ
ncbi:phosphatase PAP2 family protein [Natronolimnobius sp. AArcel1]|uniref:phosphatase PAP2 family protein n=1 Tax=Natronolimnobius sp. AArcel1 TaxID=1679093 RepID=UPI0013EDBD81|nr:phosphatase PAP2 family protein [Natronolimnobius sp. AArcel1]NGM69072.1 phosphatase PAP2 family protein [Natronolimnobius sp. AArcel1]